MTKTAGLKKNLAGIITGASSGIGRALAIMLAQRFSARLVINARSGEKLTETQKEIESAGGQAHSVVGDISNRELAESLVNQCLERFGDLNLIVNNAGLARPGPVTRLTPDDWHHVFAVNFFGALYTVYAALPHLIQSGTGKIVNISSVAGKVSFPGSVCYAASKFALTGLSLGLAAELKGQGIDVITVSPGWVRTEFFEKNSMGPSISPTHIAQQKNLKGWLMRHILSISSEEAASDIIKAMERGGSREIILTAPGIILERMAGLFPGFTQHLATRVPSGRRGTQ